MSKKELTKEQIERQDFVDNACNELILELGRTVTPWNIELISIVREAVQEVVCNCLKRMTEMEFYPYIKLKKDSKAQEATIIIKGGAVQGWLIPAGLRVIIKDYDLDDPEYAGAKTDESGDLYQEIIWEGEG